MPSPLAQTGTSTSRGALVILAVLATAYGLSWMSGILAPLALALFLAVMIDGFARQIRDRARVLPEWSALPLALLLTVGGTLAVVWVVAENGAGFVNELIADAPRLNSVIAKVAGLFHIKVPPTVQSLVNQLNPGKYVGALVGWLQSFGAGTMTVLLYLGFLIASRQGAAKKVGSLFPDPRERRHAEAVFDRIRNGLQSYLWLQTVTGVLIAVGAWAAMALVRLDNAVFWAFLIFVLCYIPVIGGIVGAVLPPLFALVQFTTLWQPIVLFGALQVVMFVVGSVLLPRMQRDSLNIDPVVVLLALAFWGAVWGLPGMFLSTPLTVMAVIILAQFPSSRWLAVLLSGDGEPEGGAEERKPPFAAPKPSPALAAPSAAAESESSHPGAQSAQA